MVWCVSVEMQLCRIGDILTFGVNHDNPTIQQAWIEQGALASGVIQAITSPRETLTNVFEGIANREAQAEALDAEGRYGEAASVRSQTTSEVASAVLGITSATRSAAR